MDSDEGFRVDLYADEGGTQLVVCGEIDMLTAPKFDAVLVEIRPDECAVVDLGQVTFMDSSALKSLIANTNRLRAAGGDLRIVNPSPPVRRLLAVSNTAEFLSD